MRRAQIEKALTMLNDAEKPLIVSDGGVLNAAAEDLLVQFAETLGVPVIPTLMSWGRNFRQPPADGRHVQSADVVPLR